MRCRKWIVRMKIKSPTLASSPSTAAIWIRLLLLWFLLCFQVQDTRGADGAAASTAAGCITATVSADTSSSDRPYPVTTDSAAGAASAVNSEGHPEKEASINEHKRNGSNNGLAIDHGQELMNWMKRTEGAFFHPHLVIRRMATSGDVEDRKVTIGVVDGEASQASAAMIITEGGEQQEDERDIRPGRKNETDLSDDSSFTPPSPFYGIYATEDIEEGELLLEIPRSMVFHPDPPKTGDRILHYFYDGESYPGVIRRVQSDGTLNVLYDTGEVETGVEPDEVDHEDYPSNCATVHKLIREMRLGDGSPYAPYVNYLLSQPSGQLPTSWSPKGQAILKEVLGTYENVDDDEYESMLQPYGTFGWVEGDWIERCQGGRDDLSEHAYLLLQQRGWDEVMIPVMDMLSHRNPPYLNTDHDPIRDGESVKLLATRRIRAGDEIYTSYNMCADCGARLHNYGTPEILRDYGFVEQYPQRWYFHSHPISFDIVPLFKTDENGQEVETGETQVKWTRSPSDEGLQFLRDQLRRLRRLQQSKLHEWIPGVPEQEWDVITKFVSAMVMAFSDALKSVEALDREESTSCGPDENCTVLDRYNQFLASDEPETWGDSRPETCDTKRIYKFDDWETLEEIQSPYQQLAYAWVPVSDDLCFDLDDTVQICASYRPHYHEMMVHYAARFLKSVKRVLFVGGGDSMLLHEALKYKELELVVGLELDQVVPRNSFRYFGTQPHFDDPRVEWWFGDATKSLTMLPSGYFGSFDLVLVDLSETVQALSVTDELNVLEALLLLVKHDGVLVQNEYMHFLEQASIFKHSLHVHYDSVPIVCSQSLILASNGIDFVRGPLYNHSVNTLYALLDAENVRHRILRDYQLNQTNPHFCNKLSNLSDAHQVAAEQVQSPGILIVLEAENTKLLIAPALRDSLVMAMRKIFGIEVLGATIADEGEGRAVITILLRNGYIVARIWPNRRYCAFDIHFWSKFHLQDPVRASIVEALGSGDRSKVSTSVYRIVASGMFGSDSWRDDDARRGPQLAELCPFPVPPMASNATAELHSSALTALIHDSADLIQGNGHDVLVLCARNVDECTSATVLKEVSGIAKVLLLHPCKDLKDDEYDQDGLERMLRCEKSILDQLMKSQSTAIRAIVLDSSSPHSLAKIVARIFSSPLNVKRWLDDKVLVGATVLDGSAWRKSFAEYFRKEVYETDPVFTADLSVTGTGNSFDFIVTSAGDEAFPRRLMDFTQKLEEKRDIVLQVQRIRSGLFSFQYDFQPDQVFSHRDYDQSSALKQWNAQLPLGLQTVFQFEAEDRPRAPLSAEKLETLLRKAFLAVNVKDLLVDSSTKVADGCVIVAHWISNSGGNAIVVWDGRAHIDLNLFSYHTDGGEEFSDEVETATLAVLENFERVLRDEQPRGVGQVLVYPKPESDPLWNDQEGMD